MKIRMLAILFAAALFGSFSHAADDLERYVVGGTQKYKLDKNGNETLAGNLAVAGTLGVTGRITTSASTPYAIAIASVTAAVPSGTPSAAGLIAFSTTYVMYVSTGTGPGAWVKIGAQ